MQNPIGMSRSFLTSQCQGRRRSPFLTVTALGFIIAVVLLAFLVFGKDNPPPSTLKFVSILFRHGDRTPTETYPTDPHNDDKIWPDGWGALTKKGKQQMFELGQFIRTRYDGFLSEIYYPSEILIKSSDHDRCLMSADTFLAGLFPPKDFQVWNPDLDWQPIPVHAMPRLQDKLLVMKKPCPKYDQQLEMAYSSAEIQKLNAENEGLYEYLSNHTGKLIKDITAVEFLYNTLEIEDSYKLELPKWTKLCYPDKMKDLAAQSLAIFTQNDILKRLKGGPLLGEISGNMKDKIAGKLKPDRKVFLYSGHDLTVVSLLRAMGFNDLLKPETGASLLLELHESKTGVNHEVQIFYIKNTMHLEPARLDLPDCGQPCFLETFLSLIEKNVPTDWEKECLI